MSVQAEKTKRNKPDIWTLMSNIDLSSRKPELQLEPLKEGEGGFVGVLSENLQKFWFALDDAGWQFEEKKKVLIKKATRHFADHAENESGHDPENPECKEVTAMVEEVEEDLAYLENFRETFWGMVRLEFPETYQKGHLSIHEGWRIAWRKSEDHTLQLSEIIKILTEKRPI